MTVPETAPGPGTIWEFEPPGGWPRNNGMDLALPSPRRKLPRRAQPLMGQLPPRKAQKVQKLMQVVGMLGQWPELGELATYKDRLDGPRKIFDDMRDGVMTDKGIRQLDHAFDLTKYSVKQPKTPQASS